MNKRVREQYRFFYAKALKSLFKTLSTVMFKQKLNAYLGQEGLEPPTPRFVAVRSNPTELQALFYFNNKSLRI